jgi:hypothetical protein
MEDLEDDGWLGDEPDDAHPLAATTQEGVDLVDTPDDARPRLPAGCKPGTVRSRRIGRRVLRRDIEESLASVSDTAMSIRVGPVVTADFSLLFPPLRWGGAAARTQWTRF